MFEIHKLRKSLPRTEGLFYPLKTKRCECLKELERCTSSLTTKGDVMRREIRNGMIILTIIVVAIVVNLMLYMGIIEPGEVVERRMYTVIDGVVFEDGQPTYKYEIVEWAMTPHGIELPIVKDIDTDVKYCIIAAGLHELPQQK